MGGVIAEAYKRANYDEVILTPSTGDFGRDVIEVRAKDNIRSVHKPASTDASRIDGRRNT
ncbi:hypothetical protein CRBSH125_26420 [Afipia carboxidovorans]|nr:hypothetical protein CRBSH125_26420 [Afipia carboxidovorans]